MSIKYIISAFLLIMICLNPVVAIDVATYADLCKIGTDIDGWYLNETYNQIADITCPLDENFPRIGEFTGTYNGNGYEIRNMQLNYMGEEVGMFRIISDDTLLTDITLINSTVSMNGAAGYNYTGSLVGLSMGGTITNCNVTGSITGNAPIGGLVGLAVATPTHISNCNVNIIASGSNSIGGIIGKLHTGTITDCHVTGSISGPSCGGVAGMTKQDTLVSGCNVTNILITCNTNSGGLVGSIYGGNVINCNVTGTIYGNSYIGGIVGFVNDGDYTYIKNSNTDIDIICNGTGFGSGHIGGICGQAYTSIENSHATGSIRNIGLSDMTSVGGLVGTHSGGDIVNSTASVDITTENENNSEYGGLIGTSYSSGIISRCSAHGNITASGDYMGGLIGISQVIVSESFAMGDVSGRDYVGGLVGGEFSGSIQNCYATGDVYTNSGKYIGGLVGLSTRPITSSYSIGYVDDSNIDPEYAETAGGLVGAGNGNIVDSYWDIETSGLTISMGNAIGKTTVEMQTLGTFSTWDIVSIISYINETWFIVPDIGYPRLAWEGVPDYDNPVAIFVADDTTIIVGNTVEFTDLSIGGVDIWEWDFGDGTTSTEQNPIHQYNNVGRYDVTLTIRNINGIDTTTKYNYISVTPDPVDFTADVVSGKSPLTVDFEITEAVSEGFTYRWYFGDGKSAVGPSVTHTYSVRDNQTFTVSLDVTCNGATVTTTKQNYISVEEKSLLEFTNTQINDIQGLVSLSITNILIAVIIGSVVSCIMRRD